MTQSSLLYFWYGCKLQKHGPSITCALGISLGSSHLAEAHRERERHIATSSHRQQRRRKPTQHPTSDRRRFSKDIVREEPQRLSLGVRPFCT